MAGEQLGRGQDFDMARQRQQFLEAAGMPAEQQQAAVLAVMVDQDNQPLGVQPVPESVMEQGGGEIRPTQENVTAALAAEGTLRPQDGQRVILVDIPDAQTAENQVQQGNPIFDASQGSRRYTPVNSA